MDPQRLHHCFRRAFLNPAGRLGDRYGHRRIFFWGLVVFTVGSAACGLRSSFVMLVGSRVVQAIGAAMLMPSSLALLMAAVPAARRAAAVEQVVRDERNGRGTGAAGRRDAGRVVLAVDLFRQHPVGVALRACRLPLECSPRDQRDQGTGIPDLFGAAECGARASDRWCGR